MEFDKYRYYLNSVQSPEDDAAFLEQVYWDVNQRRAHVMREDFCAAFALCCEWVKRDERYKAIGVDLDDEPVAYGKASYLAKLSPDEKSRVEILLSDVLASTLPQADIICALNFSYMGFKSRALLKSYFEQCLQSLDSGGIMVVDCFGGSSCQEPNEHETEHEDFSYFWDQDSFNHLTSEATFYIHYQRKGEPKREKVFSYDWRLWSLAELRDLFEEVGFSATHIYWEGTDEDGDGDGVFTRTEESEDCESWVAYMIAVK